MFNNLTWKSLNFHETLSYLIQSVFTLPNTTNYLFDNVGEDDDYEVRLYSMIVDVDGNILKSKEVVRKEMDAINFGESIIKEKVQFYLWNYKSFST